jgi:predicted nuclease of predicted toxin-antitoxin system
VSVNSLPDSPEVPGTAAPRRLLLDEMLSPAIAEQLRAKGHDAQAVAADPGLMGLSDEELLIGAAEAGRSLVTANIKDFVPLDTRYRAAGRSHAGLILLSSKTFPQDRAFVAVVIGALSALLSAGESPLTSQVVFLQRG